MTFLKSDPTPCATLRQLFLERFELVVAHFGPPKVPKCLENGLFWDQNWVRAISLCYTPCCSCLPSKKTTSTHTFNRPPTSERIAKTFINLLIKNVVSWLVVFLRIAPCCPSSTQWPWTLGKLFLSLQDATTDYKLGCLIAGL